MRNTVSLYDQIFLTWAWSKTSDSGVGFEGDILIEGKRSLDWYSQGTLDGDGVGVELLQVDDRARGAFKYRVILTDGASFMFMTLEVIPKSM